MTKFQESGVVVPSSHETPHGGPSTTTGEKKSVERPQDMMSQTSALPPGAWLVYREFPLRSRLRAIADGTLALVFLAITAPIMAVAVVAILAEDGWPVLFSQKRVGKYERLFLLWKLRTMRKTDCKDSPSPRSLADPRITNVGRILRRLSIDELPQLLNVLRGEMALVGPRPEMPFVVRNYEHWQHVRHLVRPGLTGLWQVELRSTVPLHRTEATLLDIEYIRTASLKTDIVLLARTVLALIRPKGAF